MYPQRNDHLAHFANYLNYTIPNYTIQYYNYTLLYTIL